LREAGSRSAGTSALQRALHTLHADDPKIFEDAFALDLAGPLLKWFVGPRPMASLLQALFPWMMPMVAHHLARARYVEERLDQLVDQGLRQYVLLGAGLDSFAFRRPDLADRVAVFEIDHPGTQARKRRRLRKLGWKEPSNVTYLAVDFEREALRDALARGGFKRGELTLFAWMGVLPYLTEESITSTLQDVAARSAPGSEIAFDTLDRAAFPEGRATRAGRNMFRAAERMGEPMITGFDPPEIREQLAATGFETLDVVTPEMFKERWFAGRPDRLAPWAYVYVVRARVR
jgi:methyltransferase (TIGR00027 family)